MPGTYGENSLRTGCRRESLGPGLVKESILLKDGDKNGMAVLHVLVSHDAYGTLWDVCATVPLLLPFGRYQIPYIVQDKPRVDNLAKSMAKEEFRDLWEDEDGKTIVSKVKECLFLAVHTNPLDDPGTTRTKIIVLSLIFISALNDIRNQFRNLSVGGVDYTLLKEYYLAIFDGTCQNFEDIPNELPSMTKSSKLFWNCCRELEKTIRDYHGRNEAIRQELEFLLTDLTEYEPNLKARDPNKSSMILLLEFMAIVKYVTLRPEIRRNFLVQRITSLVRDTSAGIKCLFELPYDVRLARVHESTIVGQIELKGVPLQKAIKFNISSIRDKINDISSALNALKRRCPHERDLAEWQKLVEHLIDGQIYFYAQSIPIRFSLSDFKVVKDSRPPWRKC